ncbi:3-phosphoshikimate 1-carboxyvinyltransferase [Trinickia caryophylli]|uniref:3-phosphoshikimate 1-carboxyvinyltransferase n=1 Tax=Trinickia caryophylli TaxID=28094 RepID=A0A1X7GJN4_TRICW|nr:3-phosphoshikimate 1-carboxyvinyltransferase [Trinickia caryophylli]PMS09886.1 5-enolpyruvylshikimate-3-phosphate synthase [Trinickia caryophylli]TRX14922.1 3-phosphoshikimate 1-carboxyvinyltransferase [Trinickia caryophylli]WQE14774.1 3-phosphoshikimate 1-carboxyvinyltransferase [Trinickia caryophylli]SMF70352.1 3-phosphoshikimate 1-carboxyvinyltransferase [Trinickia caryophylli]GLU34974.1 3-phosphoshikimate 1-carboxyvinyltransferase [Trinickia caryophylli]
MYLRVEPIKQLGRDMRAPASKPETQRAILAATLAAGTSTIHNDLRCLETETMKIACRKLGAIIKETDDSLVITGAGGGFSTDIHVIDAKGSGLVFRTMMALNCVRGFPTILTGDATLRRRVMKPLFDALHSLGASFTFLGDEDKAPVINWGKALKGTHCQLAGDISSQFVTAILMAAPLGERSVDIEMTSPVLSNSYIAQTLDILRTAGLSVEASDDYSAYRAHPGTYQPFETAINADFTSLSYLLMACVLFPGNYRISGIDKVTLQGEQLFVEIVEALGAKMRYEAGRVLHVDSSAVNLRGHFEFDVSHGPNIIPTLVALSLFVEGKFTVRGGAVTRFHKSSRIESMVAEVLKLGADIEILYHRDGHVDGFVTRGRPRYAGGVSLSSQGDHRNFMSLFVAALRFDKACNLDGYSDVSCSFPDFLDQFEALGVQSTASARYVVEAADE